MVRIHFERDGTCRLEVVLLAEGVVSFLQKFRHVRPQHGHFFFVKLHLEMRRVESCEMTEAVQQRQRVHVPNVEWIALVGLIERRFAFVFLADAHQVHAQRAHRVPIARIQAQRFARETDGFFVQAE